MSSLFFFPNTSVVCTVLCCVYGVYVHSLLMRGASFRSVPSQECAEFKQQPPPPRRPHSAPSLPPFSSQQLGAIFLLLCVSVMGKGPDHHRREEPANNYAEWQSSTDAAGRLQRWARRGQQGAKLKRGEAKVEDTPSVAASFFNGIDEQEKKTTSS